MKNTVRIAAILSILFLATAAFAEKNKIVVKVDAHEVIVVINKDGKKEIKYVPAASIVPKDVVRYTITYHNESAGTADDVVINNPIPEHMRYIADTATNNSQVEVTYSVDKGKTYDKPDNLYVVMKNGKKRNAVAGDYTNIQWKLKKSLPHGAKGAVEYKARLD